MIYVCLKVALKGVPKKQIIIFYKDTMATPLETSKDNLDVEDRMEVATLLFPI